MKAAQHIVKLIATEDGSHTFRSDQFQTTFHSVHGAIEESKHVFIQNGLLNFLNTHPKKEVHILEIGFGTGLNAYLTFLESQKQSVVVHYHAVELYPISTEDAKRLNYAQVNDSLYHASFLQMHLQEWNIQSVISSEFNLTKHLIKAEDYHTTQTFDLIYFDAFSPKEQPELWTEEVFRRMHGLLNEKGSLVTYCAQGQMKRNLKAAGFVVKALQGFGNKREMTRAEKI
ncbi:MAG: tRNA (5-methylaminomethyl-2-thiouridine)(34)-methyltransferase MnmD [Bacteroidota bacterium]